MRKISFLVMFLLTMSLSVTMISCGDDDNTELPGGGTGGGDNGGDEPGGGSSSLTVMEQKQKLESAANALMGKVNAADFQKVVQLTAYAGTTIADDSEVGNWFEACAEGCVVSASADLVQMLYKASNFYGRFELQDGKWKKTADDVQYLEFCFYDASGTPCTLRLTCSGKETTVHHEVLDEMNWEYIYHDGHYIEVCTKIENSFVIPEKIDLRLTQGNAVLASADMTTAIGQSTAGEFDYTMDNIDIAMNVTVGNYSVTVDKLKYSAGKEAALKARLVKAGETLVTLDMNATGDITDMSNPKGDNIELSFDILGTVAVRGNLSSVERLGYYSDQAELYYNDETKFKETLNNANQLINLGLYFDGSNNRSAYLKMYPFLEKMYGQEVWTSEPVLVFPDGTSYSTMQSYFDEEFFGTVIGHFQSLVNDFLGLVQPSDR